MNILLNTNNMNDISAVAVVLSTGILCCLRFINMVSEIYVCIVWHQTPQPQ